MELLVEEPMPVNTIAARLAISPGYIRTQLKAMEIGGLVERVDDRLPYYYRNSPRNILVEQAAAILKRKKQLMLPIDEDKDDRLIQMLKSKPKSKWLAGAEELEIIAAAIKQLDSEDKLHDTL